jgi:sugar O-acyltransferase (sialic acid O-acetyltransferase NeuD family)
MEPLLLIGAGGHAKACIDVIEQQGRFEVIGLVGREDEFGESLLGYAVIGTDADLPALVKKAPNALITIGQIKSPDLRIRLFELLLANGFRLPSVVSPSAYVSGHAAIGAGTIVMHDAIVNADAVVGDNCIINTRSLVEHDVKVADHCHISTGAIVNGHVNIGKGCFIGSGSAVRESVIIAERCVIGMGQQITKNCAPGTIMPVQQAPV